MYTSLFAVGAIVLADAVACYSTGVNYTAKFDNIQGTTIPAGYMGLNYTNFKISKAQPYLNPKSAPNMIASTDLFGMEIAIVPGNDYYYGTINSFNMACLSCVGSECLPGFYPLPCTVTVVSYVDGFPETQVRTATLTYNPPPSQPNQAPNANMTMKKVIPQTSNGPLQGTYFRLFFTSGVIGSTVYFDNINYRFGN